MIACIIEEASQSRQAGGRGAAWSVQGPWKRVRDTGETGFWGFRDRVCSRQ